MAAGLGFKTFTTGEVLTAADVNGYLMQGILVFANAAGRSSAITSPQEGQYSFLKDTNALEYYDGAAWVGAPVGDITSVTAGTGISGGGSSGDVTITNSMATAIDAKGDLIAGTGADTFSRLAVGANNTVLTADSTTATGLKWATTSSTPTFSGCLVYRNTAQALTQNVEVVSNFPSETYDTDNYHDNTTNNSRLTVPTGKSGYYLLFFGDVDIETSAQVYAGFYKNGAKLDPTSGNQWANAVNTAGYTVRLNGSMVVSASAGDYFQLFMVTDGTSKNSNRAVFGCAFLGA